MKHFIDTYLKLEPEKTSLFQLLVYISIAYLFGLLIRFILWYQVSSIESFWFDGAPLPIYSADAGLYGYYAKQLLAGAHYSFTSEYIPGHLIYGLVTLFHLNIDWVMFLLPAFLAALVVIPIILMGYAYHNAKLGFYAALISVIGINFYTRSHVGYMDTDTLNLFFPYMAVASAMMALQQRKIIWVILFIVSLAGFYLWYHSALIIIAAIAAMAIIVAPFIFKKKLVTILSVLLVITSLFFIDFSKVVQRASDYFHADNTLTIQGTTDIYHFKNTLESVAEAQQVNVLSANEHYVGMIPYTILATIGFLLLAIAQPAFLIALPLIALGYAAAIMGMRFTMFATPAYALGFVTLGFLLFRWLEQKFENQKWRQLSLLFTIIGVTLMLVNILRTNTAFHPSYFQHNDVKALQAFRAQSQQKDLLISWWDYGWPLWYYTGRNNTLIDNGRHGADTYLVSKLLLSNSDKFVANALHYFSEKQQGNSEILAKLASHEDLPHRFLELEQQIPTTPKSRDTYIMLHRDMLLTFKTLEDFAHIDLVSGEKTKENSQLYISDLLQPYSKNNRIIQGDTFDFDLHNGNIKGRDGATAQVNGIIIAEHGKVVAAKRYNPHSAMNLIIYNKTKAIYLDNRALNTFLIKALLFDQYDKKRFEKTVETETFKIFKLK